jgi:hypothetical protein
MIKKSGWFLIFVLMTASCLDEPECFSLNNNIVGISFKKMTNRQSDTVYVSSLQAVGTDSIFEKLTALNGVDVPLNYFKDTTDFIFTNHDGIYDLRLTYDSKAQFVSEDCGERYVIDNLHAISTTFDSIRILNSSPKRSLQSGTTLELYRCPSVSAVKFKFLSVVELTNVITNPQVIPLVVDRSTFTYVTVPLDTDQTQADLTFVFADNTVRHLTITYARTTRTFFEICGPQIIVHDLQRISTDFSNAVVVNDSIQDNGAPNIEITY